MKKQSKPHMKIKTIVSPHYVGTKSMGQAFEDIFVERIVVQKTCESSLNEIKQSEMN